MKRKYMKNAENRQKISGRDSNEFFAPHTVDEALEIIADRGEVIEVIAGGTDIMVEKFEKLYEVRNWLSLGKIDELKNIRLKDNKIEIGAGVTHTQITKSDYIKKYLPALKEAALDVGSPQIRNRGTIGGNIVTSSPAGDLLPVLLIYNAEFELVSNKGSRKVAANDFFTGVKSNLLKEDEILKNIIITIPSENNFDKWIKIGKRKALVISSLTLAMKISLDDNCEKIDDFAIAMGAVAPTPLLIDDIKNKFMGNKFSEINFDELASIVEGQISPIDDIRATAKYRSDVAYNITLRALKDIEKQIEGC